MIDNLDRASIAEGPQDSSAQNSTPYELTLASLTPAWRVQAVLNCAMGFAFTLVAGPLIGIVWAASLCAADQILARIYRRWSLTAAVTDTDYGLRRVAALAVCKAALWFSAPTAFTLLTHSTIGRVFVGVTAAMLITLAASSARYSRLVFMAMTLPAAATLAISSLAVFGPLECAGVLVAIGILVLVLRQVASGSSRAESEWNQASRRTLVALAQTNAALAARRRSELDTIDALQRAEAASQAKSEFLATISHEIRTPLNGVLGMAQAMEADEMTGPQRRRLDVIRRSGESLLVLLNSVLDLSKMEAGKLELEEGEVDIADAACLALDAFSAAAVEKGLDLIFDIAPQARGIYAGDPVRVGQVLYNLVSNAVKFTAKGSVSLLIERPAGALVIRVTDTGIGVAPDQHENLFEKFVQGDASVTRRYGGSGLGLAISRELVARMNGAIDLESEVGQGSTFIVTLPLAKLRQSPKRAAAHAHPAATTVSGPAALRVLVAEDNPVNRLVLQAILGPVGIVPVMVVDGEQAVTAWREVDWDLILMDVQMPVMDGVVATQTIRREEAALGRAPTPIIGVTANVMAHQLRVYRAAGMNAVVGKPIEFRRLLEVIEATLSDAAEAATLAA
jgi:signal transduction histidine kinase/AmiR/NasT family two-component response regulator